MPLVPVIGADDRTYTVAFAGQDPINDASGALTASALPTGAPQTPQVVAAANAARQGFLFQNTSQNAMLLNEDGVVAASQFVVNPGAFFPPPGYPIPTGQITVEGSADSQVGDTFAARWW